MTTPSADAFEYNDDSVVARVSIDVPSQAITDISQLSSAMGAMRTQLEAISRSQGDWLDYLQQVPVIAERANQAYRDQITQLERISYIQNELGQGGGGNVSPQTPMRSAAGGSGYSTAAPAGYVDPFRGSSAGMGNRGGSGGAAGGVDIDGQLQALAAGDPRMVPNAASARGMAINPSLAGFLGGAAGVYFGHDNGGMQGKGQDPPGSESSQPTQKDRIAAGQPNAAQGGTPVGSDPQRHPATPGDDASAGQQLRDSMWNEVKKGYGGSRVGQILGSMAPGLIGKLFGGGGPGEPDESVPGTQLGLFPAPTPPGGGGGGGLGGLLGGLGGKFGKMGGIGAAGAALGIGLGGYGAIQSIGERMTRFQTLGSEEGGDYATGAKEELHARMLGLDPFITTEDARKAIQMPMSQGYKGDSRDEIRDFLINNFKELGVTMAQSASIEFASMRGVEKTDENVLKTRSSNEATMNVMKELAGADGNGMSKSQRIDQLDQLMNLLTASGGNTESIQRSALQWQEGFGKDSTALAAGGSKIIGQTMKSNTLLQMAANKLGVTGMMPGAIEAELTDMGYSETEITELSAREAAKYVSGVPKLNNRIATFQAIMAQDGVQLDWPEAKALYLKVTGDKSPTEKANEIIAKQGGKSGNSQGGRGSRSLPNSGNDMPQGYEPSDNATRVADEFSAARQQQDLYAPSGQNGRPLPQNASQVQRQTIDTRGSVSGEVRITIDQQGRATSPPVIQLTGTQRAVNSGVGSAQLNNAPASEPRGTSPLSGSR